jgi:hypothetical protein
MTTATMTQPDHAQECAASYMAEIDRLCRMFHRCGKSGHNAWAEDIYDRLTEMPLSTNVRCGWRVIGEKPVDCEYEILLRTEGPAVRITGDLDSYGDPVTATLECKELGAHWRRARDQDKLTLMIFANMFYYGEF